MSTVTDTAPSAATVTATMNDVAIERAALTARIKEVSELSKKLNARRLGLCPRLTRDELFTIVTHEEEVEVDHETSVVVQDLRKNRQMSDEDKDQIAGAKLAHKRLINTPEMKQEACEMLAKSYLSQFKLTHKKDGRVGVSVRGQI